MRRHVNKPRRANRPRRTGGPRELTVEHGFVAGAMHDDASALASEPARAGMRAAHDHAAGMLFILNGRVNSAGHRDPVR